MNQSNFWFSLLTVVLFSLVVFVYKLVTTPCQEPDYTKSGRLVGTIDNVRVLADLYGYTILYDENGIVKKINGSSHCGDVSYIPIRTDCPKEKFPYAEIYDLEGTSTDGIIVHIHNVKELEAGTYKKPIFPKGGGGKEVKMHVLE